MWPALALGDPMLIDTPPRSGTADAANLQKLVDNANKVFDEIATGAQTANLTQVFGATKVATARAKYAKARQRMNFLHARNKVVADRSGYNFEVNLGGLTNSEQISLAPSKIDRPDDPISVVTMIHESMHAGNDDVLGQGLHQHRPGDVQGGLSDRRQAHERGPLRGRAAADPRHGPRLHRPRPSRPSGAGRRPDAPRGGDPWRL